MNLMMTIMFNTLMSLTLILIAFLIPQMNMYMEKVSPYECGFDPTGTARLPFSMKFFLIAITFLLFDLEIALLLPIPWAIQFTHLTPVITMALILISILALGLAYEWTQKGLEWHE